MEVHEQHDSMENITQSPFKLPSNMSGTPLQQISPERLNQQRIVHSPSLPVDLDQDSRKIQQQQQHRLSDASDVKARIAILNSISQNGSPTRSTSPTKPYHSSSSHAAIQRAILGREEAESTLNSMTTQLEAAKARERLVAERVESLMEQLTDTRARQRHERQVYEKEVKSCKKSEYKAELAVIKLQEELREVKGDLEGVKVRADHDKAEKEKARQEAFERAYVIAGMTEELEALKEKIKVAEQDRDNAVAMAASRLAKEEKRFAEETAAQVASVQAGPQNDHNLPTINSTNAMEQPVETVTGLGEHADLTADDCPIEVKYTVLQQQFLALKKERDQDRELVHFMNMQCQFKACACRMAERDGVRFVHDYEYDQKVRARNAKKRKIDDEKPLPRYLSWAQKIQMRKDKHTSLGATSHPTEAEAMPDAMDVDRSDEPPTAHMTIQEEEHVKEPTPSASAEMKEISVEVPQHNLDVEAAAQIPLPTPTDTPDHTAQLEDITQVIVQPGTSIAPFSFSTSMSEAVRVAETLPQLTQSQSSLHLSDDLFDLSPPKHVIPRPSTAMGVLTVASPIRLVPDSPHVMSSLARDEQDGAQSRTTRIALNDTSPVRQARSQQRPISRNHVRSQSRGRSPVAQTPSQPAADLVQLGSGLEAASPVSSTLFPITPVAKHVRTHDLPRTQPRAQAFHSLQSQVSTVNHPQHDLLTETTITTTIPLRSESESVLPPGSDAISNAALSTADAVNLQTPLNVQGTPITREAALAQIRARRDRARSVNMRHHSEDTHPDGGERRGAKTPGSVARRGVKIDLGSRLGLNADRGREISQASAPGRF